jgi:hypothetical protein
MQIRRSAYGPTSSVEAMAKAAHVHDLFLCPHREKTWHDRAAKLRDSSDEQVSVLLKSILRTEYALVKLRRFTG